VGGNVNGVSAASVAPSSAQVLTGDASDVRAAPDEASAAALAADNQPAAATGSASDARAALTTAGTGAANAAATAETASTVMAGGEAEEARPGAAPLTQPCASAPGDVSSGGDNVPRAEGALQAPAGAGAGADTAATAATPNDTSAPTAAAPVPVVAAGGEGGEAAGAHEGAANGREGADRGKDAPLDGDVCDRLGISSPRGRDGAPGSSVAVSGELGEGGDAGSNDAAGLEGTGKGKEDAELSGAQAGGVSCAPDTQGLDSLALSPTLSLDVDDQSMAEAAQEFLRFVCMCTCQKRPGCLGKAAY